jgi:hypothetical protein
MDESVASRIQALKHELIPVNDQQEINYDALFKVIVIGDTGKSSKQYHF